MTLGLEVRKLHAIIKREKMRPEEETESRSKGKEGKDGRKEGTRVP